MLSVSRQRKTIKYLRGSHFLLSIIHLFNKYLTELGFPGGSDSKDSACNAGNPSSIHGWGRSLGERNSNPFQDSGLGNPRSLVDYSPWSYKESDTAERLTLSLSFLTE